MRKVILILSFFISVNSYAQHAKPFNFYLGISSLMNISQGKPMVGIGVSDGVFNPIPAGETYEYLLAYRGVSYFSFIVGGSAKILGSKKAWFGINLPVELGGQLWKIDVKQGGAFGERFESEKGLFSLSVPVFAQFSFNSFYEESDLLKNGFTFGFGPKMQTGPFYFIERDTAPIPDLEEIWFQFGGNIGISFTDRSDRLIEVNFEGAYGFKETTNWGGEQYSYSYKLSVNRYF